MPDVLRVVATSPYTRLPVYRRTLDDIVGIRTPSDVVRTSWKRAVPGRWPRW
jgi:CBS domain containing-hemolysin-like protein